MGFFRAPARNETGEAMKATDPYSYPDHILDYRYEPSWRACNCEACGNVIMATWFFCMFYDRKLYQQNSANKEAFILCTGCASTKLRATVPGT